MLKDNYEQYKKVKAQKDVEAMREFVNSLPPKELAELRKYVLFSDEDSDVRQFLISQGISVDEYIKSYC